MATEQEGGRRGVRLCPPAGEGARLGHMSEERACEDEEGGGSSHPGGRRESRDGAERGARAGHAAAVLEGWIHKRGRSSSSSSSSETK